MEFQILYQDCVRAAFLDPLGWSLVVLGLVPAIVLASRGRLRMALIVLGVAAAMGAGQMYLFYEMNCVELL